MMPVWPASNKMQVNDIKINIDSQVTMLGVNGLLAFKKTKGA